MSSFSPDAKLALEHLKWLVSIDSTNPPRKPEPLIAAIRERLPPGFDVRITDLGDGCVALLAIRGTGNQVLFNVHVDTVPVVPGWSVDPFALTIADDRTRAFGLGACDAKGAAAALLAAAHSSDDPVAILFTTDEEAGQARCAKWFAAEPRGFSAVVVGEPTDNLAVVSHRGVATARLVFEGDAGHSSERRPSANHALVRWAGRALAFAEERAARGFDVRLNLGRLDGGEKPNVVAGRAEVRFGVRPPPGTSPVEVLQALFELAPSSGALGTVSFVGEPLPQRMHRGEQARRLADTWKVRVGESVDFWTEAAVFASVVPALVYGPGSIKQAHTADEFVEIASLATAVEDYRRAFRAFAEMGA